MQIKKTKKHTVQIVGLQETIKILINESDELQLPRKKERLTVFGGYVKFLIRQAKEEKFYILRKNE